MLVKVYTWFWQHWLAPGGNLSSWKRRAGEAIYYIFWILNVYSIKCGMLSMQKDLIFHSFSASGCLLHLEKHFYPQESNSKEATWMSTGHLEHLASRGCWWHWTSRSLTRHLSSSITFLLSQPRRLTRVMVSQRSASFTSWSRRESVVKLGEWFTCQEEPLSICF